MDRIYFLALIKFDEKAKTWDDQRLVLAKDTEHARHLAIEYYKKSGEDEPAVVVVRKTIM